MCSIGLLQMTSRGRAGVRGLFLLRDLDENPRTCNLKQLANGFFKRGGAGGPGQVG